MVRAMDLLTYESAVRDERRGDSMRVEMLGHACLLCETEDTRIFMDPWIAGPANFRSCWHVPAVWRPLRRAAAERYGFDSGFRAVGTAGPFPKCYRIEDMSAKAMDPWIKERSMLSNFLSGAKTIKAKTVVPFAGGFALLADRL